jgi:hypothetical protein
VSAGARTIARVELWQALLLVLLLALLAPRRLVEPWAFVAGGLFMGVNFLLLGFGLWWVLAPLAGRGRMRTGVVLLLLKFFLLLALSAGLFFGFGLDPLSFALGFSTLPLALFVEALLRGTGGNG